MAAYATLGALSLLWGSSFLLIKIAAGLFEPLGFALARVGVAAAALLASWPFGRQRLAWPPAGPLGDACRPVPARTRSLPFLSSARPPGSPPAPTWR